MATITIEDGIFHKLTHDDTDVMAIVVKRVYPLSLPPTPVLPALVYQRISSPRVHTHQGAAGGGLAYPRFQFTAWGTTFPSVRDLMQRVRVYWDGFAGTVGAGGNTVVIQCALIDSERDDYEPETQRYFRSQDYIIWHEEVIV